MESRIVSFDGQTEALEQDFSYSTIWGSLAWTKQTTVTTHDLLRGTNYTTVYNYLPGAVLPIPDEPSTLANASYVPMEQSIVYNDISGNPLRTVTKNWNGQYEMQGQQVVDNGTVISDQYFLFRYAWAQITDKYECGAGQTCYNTTPPSAPTAYARHTNIQYASFANTPIYPSGPSILDRPSSVTVTGVISGGNTGTASQTTYSYDAVGNALSKKVECLYNCTVPAQNSYAVTSYTYDSHGQVSTVTDPNGNTPAPHYDYNMCSDAYVSKITNPLDQYETFNYDCASGRLLSATDLNNQTTTYSYSNGSVPDPLGRLMSISYPDGGSTTYSYGGTACAQPSTITKLLIGNSNYTENDTLDGFCRVTETAITDPESPGVPVKTDTIYDGMGKVWKVSNPYRTTSDPTYGLTTYTYDAIGRPSDEGTAKSILHPDGTTFSTLYSPDCVTLADEQNHARKNCSDPLGHLISVTEDPTPGGLNYSTTYSYDALDNLLTVSQSGQSRGFTYDSLSRLYTATNPESGLTSYGYDPNGNLTSKTDARNITTTYGYDALNRVLYKNYSDPSTVRACYAYDGLYGWGDSMTNAVGHLTSSWAVQHDGTVVAADESFKFDPMGRLNSARQCTPGTCGLTSYPIHAEYDALGNELNFWDSLVRRYSQYDSANRLQNFTASLNVAYADPAPSGPGSQVLISITAHSPLGALANAALGSTLAETRSYTNRGWLGSIAVGSAYTLNLGYAGNGNVLSANDNTNGNWTYSLYDGVNRLKTATNTTTGQTFSYNFDAWGNMACTNTGNLPCTPLGLAFNNTPQNNQITTSGYSYDQAGNLLSDNTHGYVYDAENRLTCVKGTDGYCTSYNATLYFYDADGKRVGKQQANALEDYVYDPKGNIASVHDGSTNLLRTELYSPNGRHVATLNGSTLTASNLFWNHADWLGTERVRTNSGGTAVESCTDTPYGMNLSCITQGDISPMHFTGKQRDYESGLDNFGARYFGGGNSLGRFMTPDPVIVMTDRLKNPQQLNLYAYVANNPMRYIDPTGELLWASGDHQDDYQDLCAIAGDACDRLQMDAQTGWVTFNTAGLDLSKNEGAALISDLVNSKNTYEFSEGPTVMTNNGPVKIDSFVANLPVFGDQKPQGNPRPTVSDVVGLNFNDPKIARVSLTGNKLAPPFTVAFHELAEAYEKIDGGKGGTYAAGHNATMPREDRLRNQRPYLKDYNHGSGGPANGNGEDTIIRK